MTIFSCFSESIAAYALSDTHNYQYKLDNWGYDFRNSGLPNAYDPITNSNSNNQFAYKWSNEWYYWKDSTNKYCYCVQFDYDNVSSVVMEQLDFSGDSLKKYYKDSTQKQHLGYATIYSYKGKCKYGYSWQEELVASQCLIWAISANYYNRTSSELSANETKLLRCVKAPSDSAYKNMVNCYKHMKADILSHLSRPEGVAKNIRNVAQYTYNLKYNSTKKVWSATIKMDSTLSQYSIEHINGVTFKKSGSNLIVTANETGIKNLEKSIVKLTKTKGKYADRIEKCRPVFQKVKTNSGVSQSKVSYCTLEDPINAYLKISANRGNIKIAKVFKDTNGTTIEATSSLKSDVAFYLKQGNKYVSKTGSNGDYLFNSLKSNAATESEKLVLDKNGKISIKNLPAGKYTLVEVKAPKGYSKAGSITINITDDDTKSVTVVNSRDNGKISIKKIFKNTDGLTVEASSEMKSAVKFVIFSSDGKYVSKTGSNGNYRFLDFSSERKDSEIFSLDQDGNFILSNLPTGKYRLREIATDSGYKKSNDVIFNISKDQSIDKKIINTAKEQTVIITKTAIDENGNEITNSESLSQMYSKCKYRAYIITDDKKQYITAEKDTETDKNFVYHYTGLTDTEEEATTLSLNSNPDIWSQYFGNCKLKNIPDNYDKIYFEEIQSSDNMGYEENNIMISENSSDVEFINQYYYYNVGFNKLSTDGEHLSGAVFGLYTADGKEIERKTSTDETTYFESNLVAGKEYYIQELSAPEGYIINSEKYTVNQDYPISLIAAKLDNKVIDCTNKPITFAVSKKDVYGNELKGAKMQLIDGDNDIIDEWTSEDKPHIINCLPSGNYILKEIAAPNGFIIATDINITINDDGSVEQNGINCTAKTEDGIPVCTMIDNAMTGSIRIKKTTKGQKNIEGIVFNLKGISDTGIEVNESSKTDKNGIARFVNTPIGTYSIIENGKSVPTGYLVANEQKVTVMYAKTTTVEINNNEKTGSIKIQKTTKGQKNIEGIEFILSGTSDSGREINITAKTDKKGVAKFNNIPVGTYSITENGKTVPTGYLVADEQKVTVMYAKTTTVEVTNQEIPNTPNTPNTGLNSTTDIPLPLIATAGLIIIASIIIKKKRKEK